jgi:membrane protein DedA with SNARE-associated domain
MMDQVRLWIEQIILLLGYPGIALVMLVENLFPPIPSELVMPFAGFLAADGKLNLVAAIVAGTIGSVTGALILYYLGWWANEPIIRRFMRRYGRYVFMPESDLDRALSFFDRYGQSIVFFGRLIPIVRSLISVPAGMHRMPLSKFLLFTTLGSSIWTTVLTLAGLFLGANWERILDFTKQYERLTLVIIAIVAIIFVVVQVRRMRRPAPTSN